MDTLIELDVNETSSNSQHKSIINMDNVHDKIDILQKNELARQAKILDKINKDKKKVLIKLWQLYKPLLENDELIEKSIASLILNKAYYTDIFIDKLVYTSYKHSINFSDIRFNKVTLSRDSFINTPVTTISNGEMDNERSILQILNDKLPKEYMIYGYSDKVYEIKYDRYVDAYILRVCLKKNYSYNIFPLEEITCCLLCFPCYISGGCESTTKPTERNIDYFI